jgi:hypothetical protein
LSNVKLVLTAVGIPNDLRYYCTLYQESLPVYIQIVIQDLEFLGMSEISSQFTFEQLGPSKLMGNLEDKTYPLSEDGLSVLPTILL